MEAIRDAIVFCDGCKSMYEIGFHMTDDMCPYCDTLKPENPTFIIDTGNTYEIQED